MNLDKAYTSSELESLLDAKCSLSNNYDLIQYPYISNPKDSPVLYPNTEIMIFQSFVGLIVDKSFEQIESDNNTF